MNPAQLRRDVKDLRDHSANDWRSLWSQVRTEYLAALADDLETIADATGLAGPTLAASLNALLDGLEPNTLRDSPAGEPQLTLVVLAATVPALAAQSLFPLLASGSAVILKPSSREPDSTRLLVEVVERLEPEVAAAVALAPDLRLGDDDGPDSSDLDRVIAYGHDDTVASIAASLRCASNPAAFSRQGHGWSAVYLAAESVTPDILHDVARDIALFDQRGCLCPQVVLTSAPAAEVVEGLGAALAQVAHELPPSPDTMTVGALRQLRDAAVAAGCAASETPLTTGLAVERNPQRPIEELPGGRSVWVYGDRSLAEAVDQLRPVRRRLQSLGVATPETSRRRAHSALAALRVGRIVPPGKLHSPGFDWVERQLGLMA